MYTTSDHLSTFIGRVITSSAGTNAVTVGRESTGFNATEGMAMPMQGTVVSSVMASFLGFKESTLPQPGSRVLCVEDTDTNCFIIGIIPQPTIEEDSTIPARSSLGGKQALDDAANRYGHSERTGIIYDNRRPGDVVDGEHVVSNEFGVLLGLYQQLANLKASELSQIQCHLLDDLVRIISHNFQHYTALGEYNIYHDGKSLMAEFGATHKPAESYGSPAVRNDKGSATVFAEDSPPKTTDDSSDFYKINEDERIKAIERFKLFLGSVGDFLRFFIVRPDPTEIRTLNPENIPSSPDTGLLDVHCGTDGGFHVRSVKEVFIEKTNWIRVPHRKAAPDDPNGDDASKLNYTHKDSFEFSDRFKYKENPFNYALQIRDYVAFVNEKLGYQNFKTHEKDFFVNDDISKETNLKEINEVDSETDLNQKNYNLRTSGIYLMPNGGIVIRDAWNSAIVMEGGNVYIQPAKDFVAQPLRNTIVKSGGHINLACKKHVDISSSEEGLRLKSQKAQYFYSDEAGIILEANGSEDSPGYPDPTESAVENIGGIVLKSKLSVYNYAENNVVSYAKNNVLLQSKSNIDIVADSTLTTYGKQNLFNFSDGISVTMSGSFAAILAEGSVIAAGAGSTVLGQKDQNLGIMYDKDSGFVDILKGVLDVPQLSSEFGKAKQDKANLLAKTVFQDASKFDDLQFHFLKSTQYGQLNPEEDGIPSTLAQQDDLLTNIYSLDTWEEKEINNSMPYPGKDLFENFYYSAEKPVNLEKNDVGADYSNKADSSNSPAEISLASLNKYTVQK
jgi:hypothetical protein